LRRGHGRLGRYLVLGEHRINQRGERLRLLQLLEQQESRFVDREIAPCADVQDDPFALECGEPDVRVAPVATIGHGRKSPSAPGAEKRSVASAAWKHRAWLTSPDRRSR